MLADLESVLCVWPLSNAHFSYKFAFCRDKTSSRQRGPFVVGSCFGLKSDGFAWECPQKVKKTSSDILVDFILTVNLQYLVHMAPNRGLLRFQLSSLCWFCGQKCDVKTYILRTRCPQGQFKVSLCDTFNVLGFLGTYLAAVMRLSVFVCLFCLGFC